MKKESISKKESGFLRRMTTFLTEPQNKLPVIIQLRNISQIIIDEVHRDDNKWRSESIEYLSKIQVTQKFIKQKKLPNNELLYLHSASVLKSKQDHEQILKEISKPLPLRDPDDYLKEIQKIAD